MSGGSGGYGDIMPLRILAVIAAVVGVILAAVYALSDTHPAATLGWSLVAGWSALGLLALEGTGVPR